MNVLILLLQLVSHDDHKQIFYSINLLHGGVECRSLFLSLDTPIAFYLEQDLLLYYIFNKIAKSPQIQVP